MCEGQTPSALKLISKHLPPNILEEVIMNLTKKSYIREKILDNSIFNEEKICAIKAILEKENLIKTSDNSFSKSTSLKRLDEQYGHKNSSLFTYKEKEFQSIIPHDIEALVTIKSSEDISNYYLDSDVFSSSLNFVIIFNTIILWIELSKESKIHRNRYKEVTDLAIDYHEKKKVNDQHLKKLNKKQRIRYNLINEKTSESAAVFYFLHKTTKVIEVLDSDGQSRKIHFPKEPECFMINSEYKEQFIKECSIIDSSTKMKDLMQKYQVISMTIAEDLNLFRMNTFIFHVTTKDVTLIYMKLQAAVALFANII